MPTPDVSSPALLEYLPPEHSLAGLAWRFVPDHDQQPVLALGALVAAVTQVEQTVSDPGVALAKLAWWQNEINSAPVKGSQHPLLRMLLDHPTAGGLNGEGFAALISSLAGELEAEPPRSLDTLRQRELRRAGDEALLLSGLDDRHPLVPTLREAAAAQSMLGRLETLAAGPCPDWLPLELVARFQLQRHGPALVAEKPSAELAQTLAGAALQWWPSDAWARLVAAPELRTSAPGRHWLLKAWLTQQRLRRWADAPAFWLQRGQAPVWSEVWQAWKRARRIYRPAAPSR